jgi:hypothetical protein
MEAILKVGPSRDKIMEYLKDKRSR